MYASATIVAGGGDEEDAALDSRLQRLLEMGVGLDRRGLLSGTDVDDRDAAFEAKADGARQIKLRNWTCLRVGAFAKKDRQRQAQAARRETANGVAPAEDDAAHSGSVCIGSAAIRRHHGLQYFDGCSAQGWVAQIRKPIYDAERD